MTGTFWDVDDVDPSSFKVRDTLVAAVSTRDVAEFCERWHYTGTSGNDMWRFGLWIGPTLLGVVSYNLPTRAVCESVFGPEHFDRVWHMGRLVMADVAPSNSESRLIAGSLSLISINHPSTWAVVTYAATDQGHVGYVYQATNAIYTGTGGDPTYYIDEAGNRRGTHLNAAHISPRRASEMGWRKVDGGPKHRYVYVLGNKAERRARRALLRLPSLPYPKGDAA